MRHTSSIAVAATAVALTSSPTTDAQPWSTFTTQLTPTSEVLPHSATPEVTPEMLQRINPELAQMLGRLRGTGCTLEPSAGILRSELFYVSSFPLPGVSANGTRDPASHIQQRYGSALDIPWQLIALDSTSNVPARLRSAGVVEVPPLFLEINATDDGYDLTLRDLLMGDEVLSTAIVYSPAGVIDPGELQHLSDRIEGVLEERRPTHAALLAALPADPTACEDLAITIDHSLTVSESDRHKLISLANAGAHMRITYQSQTQRYQPSYTVDLVGSNIEELVRNPLVFQGVETSVIIATTERTPDGIIGLRRPPPETSRDEQGNLIFTGVRVGRTSSDLTLISKTIYPQPIYEAREGVPLERTPRSITVPFVLDDRSSVLATVFHQMPQQPVCFIEGTPVYSSMSEARVLELADGLASYISGTHEIEALFGLEAGEVVGGIVLTDTYLPNAHFSPISPDVTNVYDEMLKPSRYLPLPHAVGRHEALHAVDHHFGSRLSGGAITALFEALDSTAAPVLLNEGIYLNADEPRMGGHAQDNPAEFFASFLNIVSHPEWELHLTASAPGTAPLQQLGLITLEATLKQIPEIPSDAPIFQLIIQRRARIAELYPLPDEGTNATQKAFLK